MIDIPLAQGRAMDRARETFVEMAVLDTLRRPVGSGRARPSASALYAAATQDNRDAGLQGELARNPLARRVHAAMLAQAALFTFGSLRAASSSVRSERHGEGCHIRIERSRAEPDQFYVVVQLLRDPPAGRTPASLILCDREDHCRHFPLPAMRNGVAQIIADADSDLMRLMDDPRTRVFLG
jgi:hypothetical protein